VKAIRVFNSQASILPQYCIVCGHCASVCPNGAKKVRDDLGLARDILSKKNE
jgi:ferredoxin